jgi:hypothetical protein
MLPSSPAPPLPMHATNPHTRCTQHTTHQAWTLAWFTQTPHKPRHGRQSCRTECRLLVCCHGEFMFSIYDATARSPSLELMSLVLSSSPRPPPRPADYSHRLTLAHHTGTHLPWTRALSHTHVVRINHTLAHDAIMSSCSCLDTTNSNANTNSSVVNPADTHARTNA